MGLRVIIFVAITITIESTTNVSKRNYKVFQKGTFRVYGGGRDAALRFVSFLSFPFEPKLETQSMLFSDASFLAEVTSSQILSGRRLEILAMAITGVDFLNWQLVFFEHRALGFASEFQL